MGAERDERAASAEHGGGDRVNSIPTAQETPEVAPLLAREESSLAASALQLDLLGEVLAGRYEVLAHLGWGGTGTVHRVFDRTLREEVALKLLRRELSSDRRSIERFHREVSLARRIAHPGVCRVFDVGDAGGQAFLTMEMCGGGTLRARLRGERPPLESRLRWLDEIARGLAAMHREGILHRDLKPENVLFRADGSAAVSDFGLALPADASTATGAGTPVYMSPEQLRGEPLDDKSDLFALGILANELLTGRRPFGDGPAAIVTAAILRDAPTPPDLSDVPSETAEALRDLIARALSKRREARPSAAAFADEVDALRRRLPEETRRGGAPDAPGSEPREPPSSGAKGARSAAPTDGSPAKRASWRTLRLRGLLPRAALLLALVALGAALLLTGIRSVKTDPVDRDGSLAAPVTATTRAAPSPEVGAAIHVLAARNGTGDAALDEVAAAVTDTARRALSTVRGLRVVADPSGAKVLVSSVQRVEGRLRFSAQTVNSDGHADPELSVDAADASALIEAARDRVIAEGRLQAAVAARTARVGACTAAREPLERYERLVGPAARSEHIAAGLPALDAALVADPRCVHAHVERARLLGLRAAERREIGDLDLAESAIRAALALSPGDVPALTYRCRLAVFRPSMMTVVEDAALVAAERACREAQEADPDAAEVWMARATLLDRTCRDEEAMNALTEAARRDRGLSGDALAHLVGLALQNGRIGVADRTSLLLLALQEEETRLGPAAWTRRAGLDPPEHAHFARAEVLLRLGREAEAVDLFREELALAGTGTLDLLAELASLRALARLGERVAKPITRDEARRLRALESEISAMAARDPSIGVMVAGALLWKDTEAALRWVDRAPAPQGCTASIHRAMIYMAADRVEQARRSLARCRPEADWERRCLTWAEERVGR